MRFFIIFTLIIVLFIIFGILFKLTQNKQTKKIDINFEDIDSLNVSKIVIQENDIDFIRNEFWFQYKQKKILNRVSFNILKKHFEEENNIKISNLNLNSEISKLENKDLVELIISDSTEKEHVAQAFREIEERLKSVNS
ncbi:hypothetical protein EG240_06465 [Paenimyroides tangerinum]|uniref:Uncharacterized protein n=1 Tax=Paenimyroides tangerinum TaxID=2488728 RepID=A0A3P3W820_9FLAO|nr:hypothetical protein [Paenimyroides tangerinum]RRJ91311.1 hypothetical protein EG240_06465 [Paenimyroides tangerinum]